MAKQDGTMGEVIKWVLILGGGYLAYEYFIAPMLATTLAPTTGVTPAATTVTGTPVSSTNTTTATPVTVTTPPPPAVNAYPLSNTIPNATGTAATLASALIARATSDGVAKGGLVNGSIAYTPQQWNYIFNEMNPGNTKNLPSSSQAMSAGDYTLARATAFGQAGLSGLGQLMRVGRNTLRTGGRQPMRTGYVRAGTPMRGNG